MKEKPKEPPPKKRLTGEARRVHKAHPPRAKEKCTPNAIRLRGVEVVA